VTVVTTADLDGSLVNGAVVGVPGVVVRSVAGSLHGDVAGLEATTSASSSSAWALQSRSRARQPRRARRALARRCARGRRPSSLDRHRDGRRPRATRRAPPGHNGAAGESTSRSSGSRRTSALRRRGVGVRRGSSRRGPRRRSRRRSVPRIFAAAQRDGRREVVTSGVGSPHHSVAAVTDVSLVVLGGRLGANSDLLLEPMRACLEVNPYPPRVEVSSLGGRPSTGTLASGCATRSTTSSSDARPRTSRRRPGGFALATATTSRQRTAAGQRPPAAEDRAREPCHTRGTRTYASACWVTVARPSSGSSKASSERRRERLPICCAC
jgi:hypothetical protein